MDVTISSPIGAGSTTPRLGFPHRAERYRPVGPPLSSLVCWSCRCMEGFLIRGWHTFFPGWCWLYDPQVGVSTPCGPVSTRRTAVFVPDLLELWICGRISDPGMRSCPHWVALAHAGSMAGIIPLPHSFVEKASSLWHGFGHWVELESADKMRDF